MRRAGILWQLVLAVAAGSTPVSNSLVPRSQQLEMSVPGPHLIDWSCRATDGPYAYEVCGNSLRRLDSGASRNAGSTIGIAQGVSAGDAMPAWKQAGAYTIEFAAAALGTLVAGAAGLATIEGVYQAGWNGPGSVPGATAYFLTSAALSATGTHYLGKWLGRGNSFSRALAGGAAGGLLGGAAFADYFVTRRNPHSAMMPIGLILPPLCAVVAYNVWRNDGER